VNRSTEETANRATGHRKGTGLWRISVEEKLPPAASQSHRESSLQELRQFVDQFLGSTNGVSFKNKPSRAVSLEVKRARDGR